MSLYVLVTSMGLRGGDTVESLFRKHQQDMILIVLVFIEQFAFPGSFARHEQDFCLFTLDFWISMISMGNFADFWRSLPAFRLIRLLRWPVCKSLLRVLA